MVGGYGCHNYKSPKNKLNLFLLNARSLYPKLDEVKMMTINKNMDIICITETWLSPKFNDTSVKIPGYKIFRNDRSDRGGGVCIYLKNMKSARVVDKSEANSNVEYLFTEVVYSNYKLLMAVFYVPPHCSTNITTIRDIDNILLNFSSRYQNIVITGDFNNNMLVHSNSLTAFQQAMEDQGFKIVNSNEPTHFTATSSTLLDIIATNNPGLISNFSVHPSGFSDHAIVSCCLGLPAVQIKDSFEFRDYKNFDFNKFENQFYTLNWSRIFCCPNVDSKLDIFNSNLLKIFNDTVPLKNFKPVKEQPPWFSDALARAIIERDLAFLNWKNHRDPVMFENFKRLRNEATRIIRHAKDDYFKAKLDPKLPSKQFWNNVKSLGIGNEKFSEAPPFSPNEFNSHFSAASSNSSQPTNNIQDAHLYEGFSFEVLSEDDIIVAFSNLKSNSIGLDEIPIKFIKIIFYFILPIIAHIFNYIIISSQFPSCWKIGKVVPVPKTSSPSSVNDYRPITILPVLSKVFEIAIKKQLSTYLYSNNLLARFQSGFRPNHSTTTALLNVVDDIRRNIDSSLVTVLVLLDFSKAFDTIDHNILCSKLSTEFKFSSCAVNLIKSYLLDRSQKTCVNNVYSNVSNIFTGVPQGSILGPLLFSLYINNIYKCLKFTSYHLYADDLQIYLSSDKANVSDGISRINSDIVSVCRWTTKHRLSLNSEKSQAIVVANKNFDTSNLPDIVINNVVIQYADHVKDLGLHIDKTLSWSKHISSVSQKIFYILRTLWSLTSFANSDFRLKLFKSFLLPHFLYADVVMYELKEMNKSRIKRMFNACVRYVFRLRKFDHISSYSNNLLNMPLSNYQNARVCFFIFDLLESNHPSYLFSKIQFASSSRTMNINIPLSNSNSFHKSFFVGGFVLWNSLPIYIRRSQTRNEFRRLIKEYFSPS